MFKLKFLFICPRNIFISPVAEGIFRQRLTRGGYANFFEVDSCGLKVRTEGEFCQPDMLKVASDRGYNITHRSRAFREIDLYMFDFLLTSDADVFNAIQKTVTKEEDSIRILPMADFMVKNQVKSLNDSEHPSPIIIHKTIDFLEDCADGLMEFVRTEIEIN